MLVARIFVARPKACLESHGWRYDARVLAPNLNVAFKVPDSWA